MAKKKIVKATKLDKDIIQNSQALAEACGVGGAGGFNPFNIPGIPSQPGGEQISQSDSLFKNMRWYLITNFRHLLAESYAELGLVQTIVDVPVDDGLRGGIEIKSKKLGEDEIAELTIVMDREEDLDTSAQGAKWNRLFGGGGIMIMTDDQDPEEPLDVAAINEKSGLDFRAVDMWELFYSQINRDEVEKYDPSLQIENFTHYDYYSNRFHKSRVLPLKGIRPPSFLRSQLRGWGMSVMEVLVRSINQYNKSTNLSYEVLDEFKIDVYKLKNLVNTLLSPNGKNKVRERVQTMNMVKNYQTAVVLDSEDEYDHKQLSFAGWADVMKEIRLQVASDLRMPVTKIFGSSMSSGLNNSDQNDMENYNSMVESQVRNKLKYHILRMAEIRCQELFGYIPDDLTLSFKPLRELTSEQAENVKTQKFTRLIQAKQAGELTTLEFRDACNKGDLFDIKLDTTEDALNPDDPEAIEIIKDEPKDVKEQEDKDDKEAGKAAS